MSLHQFKVTTCDQEFVDINAQLDQLIQYSGLDAGLATVFIQHTSASLLIQENADPAVRDDLQAWFKRLVPEGDSLYTHTAEGLDDMPAHIKSSLTASSLAIPVLNGRLALGTWQTVYVWEHRYGQHQRHLVLHFSA